ncbi:MAG: cyclophane-forming radical SAM/SPASM peptide maturase YhhB [Alphaproteobacteria bacterium]|nr:cyclophane-forming radical SAM/SPASM peptide maturase YhhB [Alphaproteobacteria bacterium]
MLESPPRFTTFLVKLAARCNLNCDYCYVFNHADQSWKSLPRKLSVENQACVAERIAEYTKENKVSHCLVIFHGGEPLLMPHAQIVDFAALITQKAAPHTRVDFSLQTNGVLLNRAMLDAFRSAKIGVSLSLDGPKHANDQHRLNHKGESSFHYVMNGLNLLQQYPDVFTGVISVIDVQNSPEELLEFFYNLDIRQLDFLLPDSNHMRPPPLRNTNYDIYRDWLLRCFDIWYAQYPDMKLRLFDSLMAAALGDTSGTDAFGLGDVSLLSIETDGSYHDLDVLKITSEGFSSFGLNVRENKISEVVTLDRVAAHRKLLSYDGLSDTCKSCSVVNICGGGSVPHRYDSHSGFDNPTIYCHEMKSLISHITNVMKSDLQRVKAC